MAQVKDYYPSLTIGEYKPGEYCMFIHRTAHQPFKIEDKHMQYLSLKVISEDEGGLAPDRENGSGLAPDNGTESAGGLEPDNGDSQKNSEKSISLEATGESVGGLAPDWEEDGGLAPDDGTETTGTGGLEPDKRDPKKEKGGLEPDNKKASIASTFEKLNKKRKKYGPFCYEAGRIIGVNKKDDKIYVQFADTKEGYCHIFKAGIPSDMFDTIDRIIQANGK